VRASARPPCRSCWHRSTSGSSGRSSACWRRMRMPGTPPRQRHGFSATRQSATSRAAACAGTRGSSRRRISSESVPALSRCWSAAG